MSDVHNVPFPSVGRIVHYFDAGEDTPLAALIHNVWPRANDRDFSHLAYLTVFTDDGPKALKSPVGWSAEPVDHCPSWSWPPRA